MELLVGAIIFMFGYFTCFFSIKRNIHLLNNKNVVNSTHDIQSIRKHLKKTKSKYDQFKTVTGLYSPVKPKSERKDEIRIDRW